MTYVLLQLLQEEMVLFIEKMAMISDHFFLWQKNEVVLREAGHPSFYGYETEWKNGRKWHVNIIGKFFNFVIYLYFTYFCKLI